jgi:hypothetical protein
MTLLAALAALAALAVTAVPAGAAPARVRALDPPAGVTASPTTDLVHGQSVAVTFTTAETRLQLGQCRSEVVDEPDSVLALCSGENYRVIVDRRPLTERIAVQRRFGPANAGPQLTCSDAPGDCSLVVLQVTPDGVGRVLGAIPIDFAPQPPATATPTTGLYDGQRVSVTAPNPGGPTALSVHQCRAEYVEPSVDFVNGCSNAGNEATLLGSGDTVAGQIAALRRFPTEQNGTLDCDEGAGCELVVVRFTHVGAEVHARFPITFAPEPQLAVAPAGPHADGATVTVTGTGVEDSYAGPPFWVFPSTGGWAVGQCAADVVAAPTIRGVFENCAVPDGGGAVEVTGGTFTTQLALRRTITSVLGETTDCAASPDACVVALTRVERDGTPRVVTVPVSLAGS